MGLAICNAFLHLRDGLGDQPARLRGMAAFIHRYLVQIALRALQRAQRAIHLRLPRHGNPGTQTNARGNHRDTKHPANIPVENRHEIFPFYKNAARPRLNRKSRINNKPQ